MLGYSLMNRRNAKLIHEIINSFYWMENADWDAGSKIGNAVCKLVQSLPFSIHELGKKAVFDEPDKVIVSGESIVANKGNTVDKFMFRFPTGLSLEQFHDGVESEVMTVQTYLGRQALSTEVSIKLADIFKARLGPVEAVTQTQLRLNLHLYPNLDLKNLTHSEETVRELEKIVIASEKMFVEEGLHPDYSFSGGNLRVGLTNGDLKLIDVMPIHSDGRRLIGDTPSKLPHAQDTLNEYKDFIGMYGR